MPGVVDRLAAPEAADMLGDDDIVLADDDLVSIGVDLDGAPDGSREHRVFVVVETNGAGFGHRSRHRVESVEGTAIFHQLAALFLEHVPDRALRLVNGAVRLGVGDTFVEQLGVEFLIRAEPQPRCEEALAHKPNLVLDLALLPARRRRAGDGLNEKVAAHLQEAAIVLPILADEHRLHRCLHVIVDAKRAGAAEEGEGPIVGVEHHLLRLARIGPDEHQPAVAEPDMSDLHSHRHAVIRTISWL